jgi:pimeloyl-ACP methyl ester carboxylesterase
MSAPEKQLLLESDEMKNTVAETADGQLPPPISGGRSGREAECAMIPVPLLYSTSGLDGSNGETIDIFIKRLRNGATNAKAMWFFQGGPGGNSVAMEELMETVFVESDGATDVYTMDHRGVGRSSPMTCPASQSLTVNSRDGARLSADEVEHCFRAFNAGFSTPNAHHGFSVTMAAHDLYRAISMFNPNQEVSVYGVSYGTYLVSRYMQVSHSLQQGSQPQATNIVLDGITSTAGGEDLAGESTYGRCSFSNWGRDFEAVGKHFLEACGVDSFCSGYLGNTPYQQFTALFDKLDSGHCPLLADVGFGSDLLKDLSGNMIQGSTLRPLLPAMIYRLDRCNKQDRAFLLNLLINNFGVALVDLMPAARSPDQPADTNDLLYDLIKYSELWALSPLDLTLGDMVEQNQKTHFSDSALRDWVLSIAFAGYNFSSTGAAGMSVHSPFTYPRDSFFNAFPETSSNVLIMNGLLDPQTPFQYGHVQHNGTSVTGGAKKWLADFPGATHGVAFTSPVKVVPAWQKSNVMGVLPCGMQTMLKFMLDPGTDPVVSAGCLDDMKPIDFGTRPELFPDLGVEDLFDGSSAVTQGLIDSEQSQQMLLWLLFVVFVLPCCGFFMCVVDLRMKMKGRVCCC